MGRVLVNYWVGLGQGDVAELQLGLGFREGMDVAELHVRYVHDHKWCKSTTSVLDYFHLFYFVCNIRLGLAHPISSSPDPNDDPNLRKVALL